jgi:hypothetical protein
VVLGFLPILNYTAALAKVFRLEDTTDLYSYQLIIYASDHHRIILSFNNGEQT